MRARWIAIALASTTAWAAPCAAQDAVPAPTKAAASAEAAPLWREAVDEAVRAEMARQELVGVAVGVIREGRVVYTAGYGLADRENKVPVTTETMFRWASVSKPVTAIAAMQLVESGKLDLQRDVREYVPEFPDKGAPITMEQLLSHLGGIVHYRNGPVVRTFREYDEPNPYKSVILALDTFAESPLVAQPGERYSYSTHGCILASAVVERAGGAGFFEQVRERICEPLGLTSLQPDYQWVDIPNRAVGYRRFAGRLLRSTNTDVSWKLGGGGFISNIEDFARSAAALMNHELVDEGTSRDMWTARTDGVGKPTGYGLGLGVSQPRGQLRIAHNGSQEKARTRLVIYPELRHGVVVMCNTQHADRGALTTAVYRAINAHEREAADARPQNLESVGP
ncbi:MAG: beta-lactamase family protein [Phycisphaerales bacterium]|nr:beta-lactamase family protein [Phycisphaerales bacterium]